MADKKFAQDNDKEQNINNKTWQDSDKLDNKSATANENDDDNDDDYSEKIPQLTEEEQVNQDKKRNDPEFDNDLQNLLPKDNAVTQLKEDSDPENLSAKMKEWQNDTDPVAPEQVNATGLPDKLKAGIESLSGIDLSDVKVHYNSPKPAEMNALAYAQDTDIHIASGQEKHLPHEAWHVVQQKQGRVKPTLQMKKGVKVNDDEGLEKEADVMGEKALKNPSEKKANPKAKVSNDNDTKQLETGTEEAPKQTPSAQLDIIFKEFQGKTYLNESEEIDLIEKIFKVVKGIDDKSVREQLHATHEAKIKKLTGKWVGLTASNKEFLDEVMLNRVIPGTLGGQRRRFTAWLDIQVGKENEGSWFFGLGKNDYKTLVEKGYNTFNPDEKTKLGEKLIKSGAVDRDVLHHIGRDPGYTGGSLNFEKFATVVREVRPTEKLTNLMGAANPSEVLDQGNFDSDTTGNIGTGGTVTSIAKTGAGAITSLIAKLSGGIENLKGGADTVSALSIVSCVTSMTNLISAFSGGEEVSDIDKATKALKAATDTIKAVADSYLQITTGATNVLSSGASGAASTMFQLSGAMAIVGGVIQTGQGIKDIINAQKSLSKLNALEDSMKDKTFALALDQAQTAQKNKSVQAVGKMISGAAAIGGGIAMIAAMTNPIGWAMIAAGGAIAGGFALYDFLKKRYDKEKFINQLYNKDKGVGVNETIDDRDTVVGKWLQELGYTPSQEGQLYEDYTTNLATQIIEDAKKDDKTALEFLAALNSSWNKENLPEIKVLAKKIVNG